MTLPAINLPSAPARVPRHLVVLESVDPQDEVAVALSVGRLWPWLVQDWADETGELPAGRMVVAVLPLEHPQALEFMRKRPEALEALAQRYPLLPVVAVDLTDDPMLPDDLVHTVLDVGPSGDPADVVVAN
jgi:hypothetical protein